MKTDRGRSEFEFWIAPNAAMTGQWRQAAFGASPAEGSEYRNINLAFFIRDDAAAGYLAGHDHGVICIQSLRVDSYPIDWMDVQETLFDGPITRERFVAQSYRELAEGMGAARIDNDGVARYQLRSSGPGSAKTLLPYDPGPGGLLARLYPFRWETDGLYRATFWIRRDLESGQTTWDNPVDVIEVQFDTPTSELTQTHHATRRPVEAAQGGGTAPVDHAASPIDTAQPYVGFFAGNNATLAPLWDADRFRAMLHLRNAPGLGHEGEATDPVAVTGMRVEKLIRPDIFATPAPTPIPTPALRIGLKLLNRIKAPLEAAKQILGHVAFVRWCLAKIQERLAVGNRIGAFL
jgi:hypothetical protein